MNEEDRVHLARMELRQWYELVAQHWASAVPVAVTPEYISADLAGRIRRAISGCRTIEDVRMVFTSVQLPESEDA